MTICVKAGRSAPKPLNRLSNCGITKISRMTVTMMATDQHRGGIEQRLLDLASSWPRSFPCSVAILSSRLSSAPACSPASTRLTNRSSKYRGCLASASCSEVPASMSDFDVENQLLHRPACRGRCRRSRRPAPAECRPPAWWRAGGMKIAMSCGLTLPPDSQCALDCLRMRDGGDALAAQVGAQRGLIGRKAACP